MSLDIGTVDEIVTHADGTLLKGFGASILKRAAILHKASRIESVTVCNV
jgi:hypothetical protein